MPNAPEPAREAQNGVDSRSGILQTPKELVESPFPLRNQTWKETFRIWTRKPNSYPYPLKLTPLGVLAPGDPNLNFRRNKVFRTDRHYKDEEETSPMTKGGSMAISRALRHPGDHHRPDLGHADGAGAPYSFGSACFERAERPTPDRGAASGDRPGPLRHDQRRADGRPRRSRRLSYLGGPEQHPRRLPVCLLDRGIKFGGFLGGVIGLVLTEAIAGLTNHIALGSLLPETVAWQHRGAASASRQPGDLYLRAIEESQLNAIYNLADVFVMPTRACEMFGMAAVEAQACGRPVVSRDAGGLKEVLLSNRGGVSRSATRPGWRTRSRNCGRCESLCGLFRECADQRGDLRLVTHL